MATQPIARRTVGRAAAAPAPATRRAPVADALSRINQEHEKAAAEKAARAAMSGGGRRFFMMPGESKDVIIVDHEITFMRHEHTVRGPDGKWNIHCECIAETENCPVCAAYPDKRPYFAIYLTVIDLTPFDTRDGEHVEWSKKLLVIKLGQQKKIVRKFETHGTLRGLSLRMSRDGDKESSIGNDWEELGFYSEEDLETFVNTYKDSQGKEVTVYGSEPLDYNEIMPEQTFQQLSTLVGGSGHTSREEDERSIGRRPAARGARPADDWEDGESRPAQRPAARAAAPARQAAPAARQQPAARPAPRSRVAEPEAEEEYVEEGAEEYVEDEAEPAARPAPRAPARQAAPAGRPAARPAARAPLQEPDDDAEAQRPSRPAPRSMAEQRRMLRGRG